MVVKIAFRFLPPPFFFFFAHLKASQRPKKNEETSNMEKIIYVYMNTYCWHIERLRQFRPDDTI